MSIQYTMFVILTLALTSLVSYLAVLSARILPDLETEQNLLLLPSENVARLLVILFCLGLGLLSGLPRAHLGWTLEGWPQKMLWGLFLGLLMGGLFYAATRLLIRYTGQRFYSSLLLEYIVPESNKKLALVAVAMGPVVVLEELLFRSLLLAGLEPLIPLEILLIVMSVWFGLLHSPQGLWGMFGAGLAGFLLGLIFLWQASLITPIVAHYVINMLQIWRAYQRQKPKIGVSAV